MYLNIIKPFFDIFISLILLVTLSPFLFLVALLLVFLQGGNPFFTQPRPGRNEKIFRIIKFRSMSNALDTSGKLLPDDQRITKIGQLIRRSSIDELPQLINVLKGEMSFVGPRPLRVRYLPYYTFEERVRHNVKPGITGLAQISGRNAIGWDNKLKKDIQYVESVGIMVDLEIITKTFKKIFKSSETDFGLTENDNFDDYRKGAITSKIPNQ